MLGALSIAAAAVLTLSACGGAVSEALGRAPDPRASTFPSAADAKAADMLPAWAPDGATDVRLKQRPGGAERIVTMRARLSDLPDDCVAVSPDRPLAPAPADGDPSDFRTVSTLSADWWPTEAEQDASVMCGAWWVGERDGVLYAFTPERRTVPVS